MYTQCGADVYNGKDLQNPSLAQGSYPPVGQAGYPDVFNLTSENSNCNECFLF